VRKLNNADLISRRQLIHTAGAATAAILAGGKLLAEEKRGSASGQDEKPTNFQIACMTLPFAKFPLLRALQGIKNAGYKYVAWGTTHMEADGRKPVISATAPPAQAAALGKRCRDLGLQPLMMFSGVYPEHDNAVQVLTTRIRQAAAGGVRQVLTFGHTRGGNRKLWVERFKKLGPVAADNNVLLVVKQHGGSTGTGQACAEITAEVDHPSVQVNYDAGNVMDYLNLDPLADIAKCAAAVRSFCIKDHRNWPRDQDCGPGFGEIDHYRLLHAVSRTGLDMPLCCENIFAPLVPRPDRPEGVDKLARHARNYLEAVTAGLASV